MKTAWGVFIGMLLAAALVVHRTLNELPALVGVHFDAAGRATSFMARGPYRLYMLLFAVVLPLCVVTLTTRAYSRARRLQLPHGDYWLAAPRIASTRAFLVAHGVWLGSLLAGLMLFVHWLVLDANRHRPPLLSNRAVLGGLIALLACSLAWVGTLMLKFRNPRA
jgi:uncharacterized membrane protein